MDTPQENFLKKIKRLYLLMNRHIEEELKIYGLARSQFQVLYFTNKKEKLTQKALQQLMQVEPATLTGIIDGLVKKGLLERIESKTDKRSNIIWLTHEGKKIQKKIPPLHEVIEATMFQNISENDKNKVMIIIEQAIQNLDEDN